MRETHIIASASSGACIQQLEGVQLPSVCIVLEWIPNCTQSICYAVGLKQKDCDAVIAPPRWMTPTLALDAAKLLLVAPHWDNAEKHILPDALAGVVLPEWCENGYAESVI